MRFHRLCVLILVVSTMLFGFSSSKAQVSYSILDSIYEQSFDTLPRTPHNGSLGSTPAGWIDDATTPGLNQHSIPGWYIWHPVDQSAGEGGANGHQRLRPGDGSSNTGAFYSFGASADATDRALGAKGANTVAATAADNMYIGLRLVNDTGQTLNDFSVAYDGEQWRTFGSGARETLSFAYSLAASPTTWNLADTAFTAVPVLNFTAPVGGAGAGSVDGNNLGRIARSGNISGINWEPGQELWLRWADPGGAAASQDGLAIDNFRFSTAELPPDPGLPVITSVMSGPASSPSTWSSNEAPSPGKIYRVQDTHTVTVDYPAGSPFPGNVLRVNSGGVVHFNQSAVQVPLLIIDGGGNITESVSGDFALGDISAPSLGSLQTLADLSFNIDADSEFFLDMALQGPGNVDFNSGDNSVLWLSAAGGHGGRVRFNGVGDQVRITERQSFGTLEMNSTGNNELFHAPATSVGTGTLVFNQPGIVNHAAVSSRLQGVNALEANAAVTIDLTKGFPDDGNPTDERRYQVATSMRGAAGVTVNGAPTDTTGGGVTLNEFEIGGTGEPSGAVVTDPYSGTITANDFVNLEIRHNLPSAGFVVNNHARLEMGHQAIPNTKNITFGEVTVNNGGTLEVGFEQSLATATNGYTTGHHAYDLILTGEDGRSGGLTLDPGATLRMQINGTGADQFDSITAHGDVLLRGTLNILVNPPGTSGSSGSADNPTYTPTVGDTFDIITIASVSPAGDYNGDGIVGTDDYDVWRADFGTNDAASDGNGNGVVDAADYVVWRKNVGQMGGRVGTIFGMFDNVTITDPNGTLNGFSWGVEVTEDKVRFVVNSGNVIPQDGTVPEPTALVLLSLLLTAVALGHRPRRSAARII